MNEIENRARELIEKHTVAIRVATERGLIYMVSEQDATDAIIAALSAEPQVPEGWALVPMGMSEEMYEAGCKARNLGGDLDQVWAAMLAAKPEQKA